MTPAPCFVSFGRVRERRERARVTVSRLALALAAWACLGLCAPALAQPAMGDTVSALEERIRELEARLEALEGAAPRPAPSQPPAPPPQTDPEILPVRDDQPAAAGAGEAVDALAAERALERTLVRTGALLLPPGQAEIEPTLSFSRSETIAPVVVFGPGGEVETVFAEELSDSTTQALLTGRIGLPFDSQLEVSAGYVDAEQSALARLNGVPTDQFDVGDSGFTDVSVVLAKTLLKSRGRWPDLVGRLTWDTASGPRGGDFTFGNGFNEIAGGLVASVRQDPLVFTFFGEYGRSLERDGVRPGDRVSGAVSALLALSPETSMRLGFSGSFVDDPEIDGVQVIGGERTPASLNLGVSSIVHRNALVDVSLSVGLTEDAPDFGVSLSVPIRFSPFR